MLKQSSKPNSVLTSTHVISFSFFDVDHFKVFINPFTYYFHFMFCFGFDHEACDLSSPTRDELILMHWKAVLTTGLPGKSHLHVTFDLTPFILLYLRLNRAPHLNSSASFGYHNLKEPIP